MRGWLVVCAVVAVAGPLSAAPVPKDDVPESLKAVQGVLPKGWSAEAKDSTITIRSEKKIDLYNPLGRPNFPAKPTPTLTVNYEITLQFRPRVTAEAYQKMRKENEETQKKLKAMNWALQEAGISSKGSLLPKTSEDQKQVDEYLAVQKTLHRLPDFYTETHSIDYSDSRKDFFCFVEEDEAKECAGGEKAIRKLFKPHKDKPDDE